MSANVVAFTRVSKRFGECRALKEVTFEVGGGEVFALLGPNGSGKTTTLRILLNIYDPDEGSVSVLGLDPRTQFSAIGPRLGVMLDNPGLFETLSCVEYLQIYSGIFGLEKARARAEIARLRRCPGRSGKLKRRFSPIRIESGCSNPLERTNRRETKVSHD